MKDDTIARLVYFKLEDIDNCFFEQMCDFYFKVQRILSLSMKTSNIPIDCPTQMCFYNPSWNEKESTILIYNL